MFTTPKTQNFLSSLPYMRRGYDISEKVPRYFQRDNPSINKEVFTGGSMIAKKRSISQVFRTKVKKGPKIRKKVKNFNKKLNRPGPVKILKPGEEQKGMGDDRPIPGVRLRQKVIRDMKKNRKRDYGRENPNERGKSLNSNSKSSGLSGSGLGVAGGKLKPKHIAQMLGNKFVPVMIEMISKKIGIKPKQMGKGIKAELIMDLHKQMTGSGIGPAIVSLVKSGLPIAKSVAEFLLPILADAGVSISQKMLPKIIGAFKKWGQARRKRKAKRGKGIKDVLSKKIPMLKKALKHPLIKTIIEFVKKGIVKGADFVKSKVGGGKFKDFIKRVGKKFVDVAGKVLKSTGSIMGKEFPKAKKFVEKVGKKAKNVIGFLKGIKSPSDVARIVVDKVVPMAVKIVAEKTGIKPKMAGAGPTKKLKASITAMMRKYQSGSGIKGGAIGIGTILSLAGLAGSIGIPIVSSIGKAVIPKIIAAFKRARAKKTGKGLRLAGAGKVKKFLGKMFGDLIQKVMGREAFLQGLRVDKKGGFFSMKPASRADAFDTDPEPVIPDPNPVVEDEEVLGKEIKPVIDIAKKAVKPALELGKKHLTPQKIQEIIKEAPKFIKKVKAVKDKKGKFKAFMKKAGKKVFGALKNIIKLVGPKAKEVAKKLGKKALEKGVPFLLEQLSKISG